MPAQTTPPPVIPSGEEIYRMLMGTIEPELLLENLPLLQDRYKDETPEQTKVRAAHYSESFEKYRIAYDAYAAKLLSETGNHIHAELQRMEAESRAQEEVVMQQLEQHFLSP